MNFFRVEKNGLVWQKNHEQLMIQPWGRDSLRVRATRNAEIRDLPGALLAPDDVQATINVTEEKAVFRNGKIQAEIHPDGHLRFIRADTGKLLLEEEHLDFIIPPARDYRFNGSNLWKIQVSFLPQKGERFYGLGQHAHGFLDQKGCVIELEQRNTQVNIPFLVSSLGYGFLWHNPAVGRVELGQTMTRWVAEASQQVDYYLTVGDSYAEIQENYADATGHAPMLPEWAAGFWQCKLRYRTQEELLSVAHEYKRRGLPLSIIVVDYFHWPRMGDWKFDPIDWPDPAGMVRELESLGVKLMVSVWGTVNRNSSNYQEMLARGFLARSSHGLAAQMYITDGPKEGELIPTHAVSYYDATNPEARQFVWEKVRDGYHRHGIKVWWLDACEPEAYPDDHDNIQYHLGNGLEVGNLYPLLHEQGFYEGMRSEGETEIVSLCRSAWAGSQRYGAAVWSGDIFSDFETLQAQLKAGLNIAMSGIPWWTTDIGGFRGGDIHSPYFQELIVRWFQYGVFCPLFRLHGARSPFPNNDTGADNEVWSFGDEAFTVIKDLLFLRERMKPYIMQQMKVASEKGIPPMRPLFFDFSNDQVCSEVDDQFMFGPDVLVAPVLEEGQRIRRLYLPSGTDWQDAWNGQVFTGGQWLEVEAPLNIIPVFVRQGTRPF